MTYGDAQAHGLIDPATVCEIFALDRNDLFEGVMEQERLIAGVPGSGPLELVKNPEPNRLYALNRGNVADTGRLAPVRAGLELEVWRPAL